MRTALMMILAAICCGGQNLPTSPFDSANLTSLTTPVETRFSDGRKVRGSGFFYFELGPDDPNRKEPHWVHVDRIYVVTAKHIIQPKRLNDIVDFSFALRVTTGDHVDWHIIKLDGAEVGRRLHVCHNERVDVAVVDVSDRINADGKKLLSQGSKLLAFNGPTSQQFPANSILKPQPGDDVLVIGYPKGIYDTFNKLPILKTGVLNTPMGEHFNGLDAFLLDFRYYDGSSGSLVISKPSRLAYDKDGRLETSAEPQYVFLGVYQGEEVWNDVIPQTADLGLGWYYYNVQEAVKNPPFAH